jgi:hypothetical protein
MRGGEGMSRYPRRVLYVLMLAAALAGASIASAYSSSQQPVSRLSHGGISSGGGVASGDGTALSSAIGEPLGGEAESSTSGTSIGFPAAAQAIADACPLVPGEEERQGCDAAVHATVTLHTTDRHRTNRCAALTGTDARSCRSPIEGAQVEVLDRDRLAGLRITTRDGESVVLTKNPPASLYPDIFESNEVSDTARAGALGCTTEADGTCLSGVQELGDHLVIVKFRDASSAQIIYVGRPYGPDDADATLLVQREFPVREEVLRDGTRRFLSDGQTAVVSD